MSDIDNIIKRVKEAYKLWSESANQSGKIRKMAKSHFWIVAYNSIMPIMSEVERLKAELETTQTRLVQAEKDDCSRIDVIADLRAELSKAQEKIKELQEYKDAVIKAKPGLLKLEKIIKDM